MYSCGPHEDQPGPKELEERIKNYLLTAFRTLSSLNLDISLYLFHHIQNAGRDPFGGNELDEAYTMYEERANECRRLWMKLRAASDNQASSTRAVNNSSSTSKSRLDLETSPSPLEYQSALGEDEFIESQKNDWVTPMDIDAVEAERVLLQPLTPAVDLRPPKSEPETDDVPPPRGVIVTPGGPTSCRLAPIPKGVRLSVETTRIPAPGKPFTFRMPQQSVVSDSGRHPLNRTKNKHQDTHSSGDAGSRSFLRSGGQRAGPSTAQISAPTSPRRNYSCAKEYWEPRRAIRPNDFQMSKDRLFNSLDCLGSPFQVDMTQVTHSDISATQLDVRTIYGGKNGLTPKIASEKLVTHGFDHWMTPNIDFHPFLPARPGWPGLMLRPDDELEEWQPDEGTEFRVVVKREPRYLEYVGQYEMMRLGDITGDEWKQQPAKVKKRWFQVLGSQQSLNDIVARVVLRKRLGKEPSIEDLAKFAKKSTPDYYATLDKDLREDVNRAFCEGEEVIAVWGMKCVGYDYKFEKHLALSLKAMKPPLPGSTTKRKAADRDDDASQDEDEEKEEDSESDDPSPHKRQRTAKGKAKLVKYDWSDARFQGDSEDEDYKPA